jgi:hypothetical protein
MRISANFGGPQTVMYGFAAVSRLPSPFPMMKMHVQNPPKDLALMAAMARRAPTP